MFPLFLGIDIAKATFTVALLYPGATPTAKPRQLKQATFPNTPAGFAKLLAWLRQGMAKPQEIHACLEATGTYGEALARFLTEQSATVSVVNPAQIVAFAKSELSRTKTDKADAKLIARYCQKYAPPAWTPPALEFRELQALVRRVESLQQMHQMEANRLEALESGISVSSVAQSLQSSIAFLDEQIAWTKEQIRALLDQHPSLKEQHDLLVSIPGVAQTTAAALLAEIGDFRQFADVRAVCAFAGLSPRRHESGTSVRGRPRLCKTGSARLRKSLYFPAMVALRFNPRVKALGERLRSAGKSKMLIVGAAMRKLLCLAFGILKSGRAFDPQFSPLSSRPERA